MYANRNEYKTALGKCIGIMKDINPMWKKELERFSDEPVKIIEQKG